MSIYPPHWKELPLKEFVIARKGKKPLKLSDETFTDSLPYLDIDAIENGNIKQYADDITTLKSELDDIFIVADGSRSGLVKRGMVGAVGSTLLCITPLAVNVDYLYYYLQSKFEYLNKNTTGSSIPHLNQKLLLNMAIPIPPIEEQNLIAKKLKEKLDQYQSDFNNAKNELITISEYKKSVLEKAFNGELTEIWRKKNKYTLKENTNQLFALNSDSDILENNVFRSKVPSDWLITNAKSICSKITDGDHQTPKRQSSGELLLTAKNIRDGYIDYENVEYIHKDDFEKSRKRCDPSLGDVLVVSVGATIGRTSVITKNISFALVRSVLLFKPLINGEYLMYCFQSPILQDVISESSTGVAQQSLYINKANELPIPFPIIEEQNEIVRQIIQHFQTARLLEKKTLTTINKIEDLQQAIFQVAFSGKLITIGDSNSDEWFTTLVKQIKTLKENFNVKTLDISKNKKIENKKFKDMITAKKTIVETLKGSAKNSAKVEDVWKQSIHFETMDIEGFYEELEEMSKKNATDKIVKWEFSDKEKKNVILKFK